MLHIDEIVRAIGVDGRSAPGGGPACRRIDGRDELRLDRCGGPEGGVIQGGKVLLNGPVRSWIEILCRLDTTLAMGGYDQAAIDGKALAADETLRHTAAEHVLEQLAEDVAFPEPAMTVLRKCRVVGHLAIQAEPAEPAVRQVEVDLLAEPPL